VLICSKFEQFWVRAVTAGLVCGLLWGQLSEAGPPPIQNATTSDDTDATLGSGADWGSLERRSSLGGSLWGLRPELNRYGITLSVQETDEWLGNTTGGIRQGFERDGLTQIQLQLDTQRAFGHYGGLFNLSVLNVHGQNISSDHLLSLETASGIEADPGVRLWELWYSQNLLDENRLNLKWGQQSIDQEFMVNTNAQYFVNTMMGWPMLPSADMPAGGPAYPLSSLGLRMLIRPVDGLTLLAGMFNGSPLARDNGLDPQRQNQHGTSFALGEGLLNIVEAQISYPSLGSLVSVNDAHLLSSTYRLGVWQDSQAFLDERWDTQGRSLASPLSNGHPKSHPGNWAWYALTDHLIWRDQYDPNRTIALFARIMGTPLQDRNVIDLSMNAGLVFKSPFRYRVADTVGWGFGLAKVSQSVTALDTDTMLYQNPSLSQRRTQERFLEWTYQYQWWPWIQIQPDIQYVWHPGAGLSMPNDPSRPIQNEWVIGIRTNVLF
jgi:porin